MINFFKYLFKLLANITDPEEKKIQRREDIIKEIRHLKAKKGEALAKNDNAALERISLKLQWMREKKRLFNK